MSFCREIITLQFGNYANYVGAHWWNMQERAFSYEPADEPSEISPDVLYREGVNFNGHTTFTPRLLLVDLNGALKHLPQEGELYGNSVKRAAQDTGNDDADDAVKKLKTHEEANSSHIVELLQQPAAPKHKFQMDLEETNEESMAEQYDLQQSVETWSDFLYARYHPRSVHIISEHKFQADKCSFDSYPLGVQVWQTAQFEEQFTDDIRRYVEECDFMQGFQSLFDCFNAHAGLATQCLQHLSDEYGKASLAVPIFAPRNILCENADEAMTDSIRVINSALAFPQLREHSSLFVPLSTQQRVWRQLGETRAFPHLSYDAQNLYQTSGILAAYLDSISLRYRMRNAPSSYALAGLCADLNNYGRKLAAAGLALPFAMSAEMDLIDCLEAQQGPLFTPLTPNSSIGTNYIIQSLTVRGIPVNRLKCAPELATQQQMRMAAFKCASVSEMFQLYLQCINHNSMAHVASLSSALCTPTPFPNEMFSNALNVDGFINSHGVLRSAQDQVETVPTLAALQSSSELADTLETLHREAKRIKITKLPRFKAVGLEQDEYDETLEQLLNFKDNYEDNFEL